MAGVAVTIYFEELDSIDDVELLTDIYHVSLLALLALALKRNVDPDGSVEEVAEALQKLNPEGYRKAMLACAKIMLLTGQPPRAPEFS